MSLFHGNLAKMMLGLAGLLVVGAAPAWAGGIGFRNDLKVPVIVQGASIVNGMVRRGPPILIQPGKIGWDNKLPAGMRYVTVYDANQPNRVIIREFRVPFQGLDLMYTIQVNGNKVTLEPSP